MDTLRQVIEYLNNQTQESFDADYNKVQGTGVSGMNLYEVLEFISEQIPEDEMDFSARFDNGFVADTTYASAA